MYYCLLGVFTLEQGEGKIIVGLALKGWKRLNIQSLILGIQS